MFFWATRYVGVRPYLSQKYKGPDTGHLVLAFPTRCPCRATWRAAWFDMVRHVTGHLTSAPIWYFIPKTRDFSGLSVKLAPVNFHLKSQHTVSAASGWIGYRGWFLSVNTAL